MVSSDHVTRVPTKAYDDQKPGTSGLRKKTKVFMQTGYLENFTQAVFNALVAEGKPVTGCTLLVSGDGRFYTPEAVQKISQIAAANGVQRVWIGTNGLVSTPGASAIIRERENGICFGGFLLTASHNPGGINEDFGIKYNGSRGEPAPESLTNAIYTQSRQLDHYLTCELPQIDMTKPAKYSFFGGQFQVEIIDPVENWLELMKRVFDFDLLRRLCARPDFKLLYDGMHGVAGPYAHAVFVNELKCKGDCLIGCTPLPDFGGGHPDPNLTYAKKLVDMLKVNDPKSVDKSTPDFGAAGDGDCDRNMILGAGCFVTPSDSVAIIASHANRCIPYFKQNPIKGVSRSMPTSGALDNVAKGLGFELYEVPTGWKFFGNLMDAKKISLCGEESFGTGSDHIREKDGIWAVLAWLSIIASRTEEEGRVVSVREIVDEFFGKYGRCYYTRYDYENVETEAADKLFAHLRSLSQNPSEIVSKMAGIQRSLPCGTPLTVVNADEFAYTDPVDKSVTENQGLRFFLSDGGRIIYRLSGTGSQGATIRIYIETSETSKSNLMGAAKDVLRRHCEYAVDLCDMVRFTGRHEPTVIT